MNTVAEFCASSTTRIHEIAAEDGYIWSANWSAVYPCKWPDERILSDVLESLIKHINMSLQSLGDLVHSRVLAAILFFSTVLVSFVL